MSTNTPARHLFIAVAAIFTVLNTSTVQAQRASDCAAYADRASRDSVGAVGGAVGTGAGGALIGALVGGRKGAKRGAVAGGVVGGAGGAINRNEAYKRAYDSCMRGR